MGSARWFVWRPFDRPRDRLARLPLLLVPPLGLLLLCLWDPNTQPGPVLCPARQLFAVPCPLCGGTRGVALCLRGRPVEATARNPLSAPSVVVGLALMALWSAEFVSGRRLALLPVARTFLVRAAYLVLAATWLYLLVWRREDDFADSLLGRLVGLLR